MHHVEASTPSRHAGCTLALPGEFVRLRDAPFVAIHPPRSPVPAALRSSQIQ